MFPELPLVVLGYGAGSPASRAEEWTEWTAWTEKQQSGGATVATSSTPSTGLWVAGAARREPRPPMLIPRAFGTASRRGASMDRAGCLHVFVVWALARALGCGLTAALQTGTMVLCGYSRGEKCGPRRRHEAGVVFFQND